ncbi:MAG: BatA domain-containing protein [Phycisphaerales bacterium]|nr:BatA domain-containing protein [Planctomycetota bacterium]
MTFLNPTLAFAALACVLAPVIIHLLFRRRRRPVEWGAMRFVLEAFRRHRRRLRLEQILLLAARTLAVLLLALAVGRPMLSGTTPLESRRPRDLFILIDNSVVSQVRSGNGTEFDGNKKAALRLLDELDSTRGDRAAVIALGAPAERLIAPPTNELGAARRALEALEPTDSGFDLRGAQAIVREIGEPTESRDASVAILSRLRAGAVNLQSEGTGGTSAGKGPPMLLTPPATEEADNCAIVQIEPLRSVLLRNGENAPTQQARVTLKRSGAWTSKPGQVTLRLRAATTHDSTQEQSWDKTLVRFAPGQETLSVLAPVAVSNVKGEAGPARPLWIEGRIDEDAVPGDNVFRRPWKTREQVRVVLIAPQAAPGTASGPESYSAADWFSLALSPTAAGAGIGLETESEPVRVLRVDPAHFSAGDLAAADAAIVTRPDLVEAGAWAILANFTQKGSLLVVTPAPQAGAQVWCDAFTKSLGLSWQFSRESREWSPPAGLVSAEIDQPLFASLGAELADLVKPVSVFRSLGVELKGEGTAVFRIGEESPFLVTARAGGAGSGLVVLFLSSPELAWTNLPAMPLMVPLVQEIVRQGVGLAAGPSTVVAGSSLDSPDELRRVEPAESGAVLGAARNASLLRRVDARGATRELIAVNPDSQASDTGVQPKERLAGYFKQTFGPGELAWIDTSDKPASVEGQGLLRTRNTPPIDLPLLIAGLVLLIADVAMSRWFSHAVRAETQAVAGTVRPESLAEAAA